LIFTAISSPAFHSGIRPPWQEWTGDGDISADYRRQEEIFQALLTENKLPLDFFAVDETAIKPSHLDLFHTLSPLLKG